LENTAELTADICKRNKIKPELLTAAQLSAGQPGVISHNLSRIVFGGTTHTDPGPTFPWDQFGERLFHFYGSDPNGTPQGPPVPDTSPLKRGSVGPRVADLQKALNLRSDGNFGEATEAAVRGFQIAQGLKPDGIAGPATALRLKKPEPFLKVKTSTWLPESLYRGKRGRPGYQHLVQVWQERLGLAADGDFGLVTEAATIGFQTGVSDLLNDGIVGKQTWGTAFIP
jgi:hypothetical protein